MSTSGSNAGDPAIVAYYRDFADTLGIFWQFHKERITERNLEFALVKGRTPGTVESFDPQRKVEAGIGPRNIIQHFAESVRNTMRGSWQQFLVGADAYHGPEEAELIYVAVPEKQKRFFDPYTRELAARTGEGAVKYARANVDTKSLNTVGQAGIETGAEGTVQLAAIFEEDLNPDAAVRLSRVTQDNQTTALREIGLPSRIERSLGAPSTNYTLLDNTPTGLNLERLQDLGMGATLGCPAAMQLRPATRRYLGTKGIVIGKETMLEDFAAMMPEQFHRYVGVWYAGLTPEQRQTYVSPEQNRILSGEVRRVAMGIPPRCPYGKERK